VLPAQAAAWQHLEKITREVFAGYGYEEFRVPVIEQTQLFKRSIGDFTDIVEKEMFSFVDQGEDHITLRPEATAGIVRAAISNGLLREGRLRVWCMGPMFRRERPQAGRYRQFHQIDVEALGHAGPDVDAEQILMCRALWRDLGLVESRDVRLEINSLGQAAERTAHRAALIAHFEKHADALDEDARRRLHSNPLRILDSKNPAMQEVVEAAPRLMEFLGENSRAHFDALRAVLDAAGLEYRVNPRLVRGLDYYNLTVFEWVTGHLGAQGTVCGGGRYDGLFEQLGGRPTPAVGWGMGIERMLLLLEAVAVPAAVGSADAYAIVPEPAGLPVAMTACEALRTAGVSVLMHAAGAEGRGSMKAQFRKADASGARYALVFGADELARGEVAVKPLREAGAAQRLLPIAGVASWAATLTS